MFRFLFLAFLIVPLIEIGLFIVLGQAIGLWPTLLGVVVTALIGSFVIRRQGISLITEIRQMMQRGQMPARQMADGVMLAVSGALLMTPGYFTDTMGFLLLVPPIRLMIYEFLKSRVHVVSGFSSSSAGYSAHWTTRNGHADRQADPRGTIDLDDQHWRRPDDDDVAR